ncbi:MAG: AbrB/MazE/SpoVT family DNA-binding domain-containing protein [Bacilli bacterium]|nr:AbrB/MazE/SpoVT family DNA-binding domain-containing protein [Bacilli bacterium]
MNRKIDDLGRLVIPKEMRNKLGIKDNDPVNIECIENKIIITNPSEVDYKARVKEAIEKLYIWGEVLDPEFQKEMLDILKEVLE